MGSKKENDFVVKSRALDTHTMLVEEEMTLEHLLNCEELKLIVDITCKYWEARRRMTLLLNPDH